MRQLIRSSSLLPFVLLLLLGVVLESAAWAQNPKDDSQNENQGKETEDKDKETCNPPEFTFSWQGYDLLKITAKADPAQSFIVHVNYLEAPDTKKTRNLKVWDKEKERRCADVLKGERIAAQNEDCSFEFQPARVLPAVASGPQAECVDFQSSGNGLSEGVKFCLQATEKGSSGALYLDRKALLQAGGLVGLSYEAATAEDRKNACPARKRGPEDPVKKVLDKHSLNFDIGSVFTFQGDGAFNANAEAAAVSRSQWYEWLQTGFSVRYSSLGVDDAEEEDDPDDDGSGEESLAADDGEGEEDDEFNPFEDGGGLLETNVYILLNLPDVPRLGLVGGWGLSSVPGVKDSKLEMRERTFVGLRNTIQAFNAGRVGDALENTSGYIQAGIAEDKLWENVEIEPATEDDPAVFSDESERYFFEGEFDIPRIGTEWLRMNLRFFASVPRSGDGPSDLRISALASIDPRRWFPGIGN